MTTSEEESSSTSSDKTYIQIDPRQPTSQSFLSILDDKNALIELLNKQLQNQKMQITYYIHKEMSRAKLEQLSKTCSTQEENMPVALAMDTFRKRNGLKSNVHHLYEHMRYIDEKLTTTLRGQEFILKRIAKKLFQSLKHPQVQVKINRAVTDTFSWELFNKLLKATTVLKRKLEAFRICCDRLILIEDERNVIADQISTMPADQKMNCNFLMNVQMENSQLTKRIKQMSAEKGLEELNAMETKLADLQKQLKNNERTNDVEELVRNLQLDAKYLLAITKSYKEKHHTDRAEAKNHQAKCLDKILSYIRLAADDKQLDTSSKEELRLYDTIKKSIRRSRSLVLHHLDNARLERDSLKMELNKALLERNELKIANYQLQRDMENLKSNHSEAMLSLQLQRDVYMAQVEQLKTIREAYVHLIDKPTEKIVEEPATKQSKEISLQNDSVRHMEGSSDNRLSWKTTDSSLKYRRHVDCLQDYDIERTVDEEEILVLEEVYNWNSTSFCNQSSTELATEPSINCFTVYSPNKNALKEIIAAMVKKTHSGEEMYTSASMTLEVDTSRKCVNTAEAMRKLQLNEEELMCDCSNEVLPAFCPPIKKNRKMRETRKSSFSRNIEALAKSLNKLESFSGGNCLQCTLGGE